MITRSFALSLLLPAFSLLPAAQAQFVQQGSKLVGTGAVGGACQGSSVGVSGDGNTAMVGGLCDDNGSASDSIGSVWVYVRANGAWSQQGPKIFIAGAFGLGTSVALSFDGNTAIVAGSDDTGASSAWVLVRANGGWSQQGGEFTRTDGVGKEFRFTSVALSGDGNTAIVGETADNDSTGAAAAVDGNTDGNFRDGSVTATNADGNAWWQVDLGASSSIGSIFIWNRTDCCGSRLSDYWIFVSDTPFAALDTPATLLAREGTQSFDMSVYGVPNPNVAPALVNAIQGRYVRVQLKGAGYLSLAEVQVFGVGPVFPGTP